MQRGRLLPSGTEWFDISDDEVEDIFLPAVPPMPELVSCESSGLDDEWEWGPARESSLVQAGHAMELSFFTGVHSVGKARGEPPEAVEPSRVHSVGKAGGEPPEAVEASRTSVAPSKLPEGLLDGMLGAVIGRLGRAGPARCGVAGCIRPAAHEGECIDTSGRDITAELKLKSWLDT